MKPCCVSDSRSVQAGCPLKRFSERDVFEGELQQFFRSARGCCWLYCRPYTANCGLRNSKEDLKRDTCTCLPISNLYGTLCRKPFIGKAISSQVFAHGTSKVHCFNRHNFMQSLQFATAGENSKPCFHFTPSQYAVALQECGHSGSLFDGKVIHDHILRHSYEQNIFISNCVGYMYGHHGALLEACAVFCHMPVRDVFSWNFLIRAYALHGLVKETLHTFHKMQLSGICPDKFSFITILSSCEELADGMLLNVFIVEYRFEKDVLLGNSLISFYGKCGSMEDARQIFNLMERKDVISWNSMISVYTQFEEIKPAFTLYRMMILENVPPDRITHINLLSASANDAAFVEGQCLHASILNSEFVSDISINNALINMYGKCGSLEDAWSSFRGMGKKDIISWNAIIHSYAYNQDAKQAFQLFNFLQLEGLEVNKVTTIAVLDACVCERSLAEGKRMHTFIINNGLFLGAPVASAIIHMYSKCQSLVDAHRAFVHHYDRSLLAWNTITAAYSQSEQSSVSLLMFEQMLCEGVLPNHITFVNIISASSNQETLYHGKRLHTVLFFSNIWGDIGVGSALVHMYGKHGFLKEAEELLFRLPAANLVAWNALLTAHSQPELLHKLEKFCSLMYLQGFLPDKVTFISTLSACAHPNALVVGKQIHTRMLWSIFNDDDSVGSALINMYGKCNALKDSCAVFESMHCQSLSCWNALLGSYSYNGYGESSLFLLHRMQHEGIVADRVTYVSILGGSSMEISEGDVQRLHTNLVSSNIGPDIALCSAFINMYGRLGNPKDALKMFITGPKHEIDTWNAMMTVLAQSGYGIESFKLFCNLQRGRLSPNEITYVSLLSGCSHSGLILESCYCFHLFLMDKSITPKAEHYNCMVDLFGRAGLLKVAQHMIDKMPFDPLMTPLLTLLSACKSQGDVEMAEQLTSVSITLDPDDPTPYIMLRNIYSTLAEVDDIDSCKLKFNNEIKSQRSMSIN